MEVKRSVNSWKAASRGRVDRAPLERRLGQLGSRLEHVSEISDHGNAHLINIRESPRTTLRAKILRDAEWSRKRGGARRRGGVLGLGVLDRLLGGRR